MIVKLSRVEARGERHRVPETTPGWLRRYRSGSHPAEQWRAHDPDWRRGHRRRARTARNLGYGIIVLKDCVGSRNSDLHELALKLMEQTHFDISTAGEIAEIGRWRYNFQLVDVNETVAAHTHTGNVFWI